MIYKIYPGKGKKEYEEDRSPHRHLQSLSWEMQLLTYRGGGKTEGEGGGRETPAEVDGDGEGGSQEGRKSTVTVRGGSG